MSGFRRALQQRHVSFWRWCETAALSDLWVWIFNFSKSEVIAQSDQKMSRWIFRQDFPFSPNLNQIELIVGWNWKSCRNFDLLIFSSDPKEQQLHTARPTDQIECDSFALEIVENCFRSDFSHCLSAAHFLDFYQQAQNYCEIAGTLWAFNGVEMLVGACGIKGIPRCWIPNVKLQSWVEIVADRNLKSTFGTLKMVDQIDCGFSRGRFG